MTITGRYAHLHKWWDNKDKGKYIDKSRRRTVWPLCESSPLQLGHLAQKAGYGTYWAGIHRVVLLIAYQSTRTA